MLKINKKKLKSILNNININIIGKLYYIDYSVLNTVEIDKIVFTKKYL